jgi:hypothetical protein
MDEALLNRVTVTKLKVLAGQIRFEISRSDIATVREKRLQDLDRSVGDLNRMAERSKTFNQRVRIYQALGCLCQIIDGLVLDVKKDEITQATLCMEKRLDLLETGSLPSR